MWSVFLEKSARLQERVSSNNRPMLSHNRWLLLAGIFALACDDSGGNTQQETSSLGDGDGDAAPGDGDEGTGAASGDGDGPLGGAPPGGDGDGDAVPKPVGLPPANGPFDYQIGGAY